MFLKSARFASFKPFAGSELPKNTITSLCFVDHAEGARHGKHVGSDEGKRDLRCLSAGIILVVCRDCGRHTLGSFY